MKYQCLINIVLLANIITAYHIIPGAFIPGLQNFNLNFFSSVFQLIVDSLSIAETYKPLWLVESTYRHLKVIPLKAPQLNYDFIVVGAGTAGSIVASRLSENPAVTVLLVEAGGTENLNTDTPGLYNQLRGVKTDWAYVSEPQKLAAFNFDGNRVKLPRGRMMGGSSSMNDMIYVRGAAADYDNWEKLGANGWSFRDVFPFFLRSERNTDPHILANGWHNDSGPIAVTSNMLLSENPSALLNVDACKELGFELIDINGPQSIGTNVVQQNLEFGLRVSMSRAMIEPFVGHRPNLYVMPNSFVTKILFSTKKEAIGVDINQSGEISSIGANKEVILSGGAINSPQLLMLSGIGPMHQLSRLGIRVISDLPGVGENLQDHVYAIGPSFTLPSTGPPVNAFESYNDFIAAKLGPLGFWDQALCVANSSLNKDYNWPDIQLTALSSPLNTDPVGVNIGTGLKQSVWNKMYLPYAGRPAFYHRAVVLRPRSRGKLELISPYSFISPKIQLNYLTNPEDVQILVDGLRWHYRMGQTYAYKRIGALIFKPLVVGCEHLYRLVKDYMFADMLVPTDEYLACQARSMSVSGNHLCGTCKIGTKTDYLAVVDEQLRVYGVKALRVIDASVMPVVPSANTNAATMMIAERGAQFIKDYYHI